MKKIRLDIYHKKGQNVVEMQKVEKSSTPAYLSPLEKMLKRFNPEHRHGSRYFFVEDKPGQSVFSIFSAFKSSMIFDAVMGSDRTPRVVEEVEETKPKLSKKEQLLELDAIIDVKRAELKELNKRARKLEKPLARR